MQAGTLERTPPTTYSTHQDHCTSPLSAQNTWQPHDICTSTTSAGTTCNTSVTAIQAKLEFPQETTLPHHVSCTKAKFNMGLNTKTQTRGFHKMFRLTPMQVGLKSIEEHVELSLDHNTNPDNNHSPTHQQTLSEHSESLIPQSTNCLISPCSSSSEKIQEH